MYQPLLPLNLRRFLGLDIGANLLSIPDQQHRDVLTHTRALGIAIRDPRYVSNLPKLVQVGRMVGYATQAYMLNELSAVPREHLLLVQGALGRLFETVQKRLLAADLAHYLSKKMRTNTERRFAEQEAMLSIEAWHAIGCMLVGLTTQVTSPSGLPWLTDARDPGSPPKAAIRMVERINQILACAKAPLVDVEVMKNFKLDTTLAWKLRRTAFSWKTEFDHKVGPRFEGFVRGFLRSLDRKMNEMLDAMPTVEVQFVKTHA